MADFLPDPEAMDDEDEEAGDDVERAAADADSAIAAALNPLGAVATGHQLVMGSGAKLPDAALGAFFGANTEET